METLALRELWSALVGADKSNNAKAGPRLSLASRCSILLVLVFAYFLTIDQGKYFNGISSEYYYKIDINSMAGSAIKCWVCRSDGDPKCADPFDNTSFPITDCAQEKPRDHLPGLEATMCRKVRQKGRDILTSWTKDSRLESVHCMLLQCTLSKLGH